MTFNLYDRVKNYLNDCIQQTSHAVDAPAYIEFGILKDEIYLAYTVFTRGEECTYLFTFTNEEVVLLSSAELIELIDSNKTVQFKRMEEEKQELERIQAAILAQKKVEWEKQDYATYLRLKNRFEPNK